MLVPPVHQDQSVQERVTHDQFLNLEHKRGVARTLLHRVGTVVSDPKDRYSEEYIRGVLIININRLSRQHCGGRREQEANNSAHT